MMIILGKTDTKGGTHWKGEGGGNAVYWRNTCSACTRRFNPGRISAARTRRDFCQLKETSLGQIDQWSEKADSSNIHSMRADR